MRLVLCVEALEEEEKENLAREQQAFLDQPLDPQEWPVEATAGSGSVVTISDQN